MFKATILGVDLTFETAPGLFSPGGPDAGTMAMLARVPLGAQTKLLDLGCGYGLVGVYAAARIGPERVWMADNDPVAVACAARNLTLNGLAAAHVCLSDGVASVDESAFTLIVCHPPYHADFSVAKSFIEKGFNRLAVGGELWMVTRREPWYRNKLAAIFGGVQVYPDAGYFVFRAQKRRDAYANRGR